MQIKRTKDNDDDEFFSVEPFMLMGKPTGIEYTVNIDEPFVHPRQFQYLVHALDNATAEDTFNVNLVTPGGALHAVLPLLGAMDSTEAHVHVHATSDVASAGTFLLMKAHSISMNEYSTVMCHQVSFGSGGSGWNVEKHVEHTLKHSKKLLRDIYKHFMSSTEMDQMLTGTDFYMNRDEFIQRYQRRGELLEQEILDKLTPKKAPRKPRAKKTIDNPK